MGGMHIVLIIGSLQGGGAERVACTLANAWSAEGNKVTILTFEAYGALSAYPLSHLIEVKRLNLLNPVKNKIGAFKRFLDSVLIIRANIRDLQPTVVVSFIDEVNVRTIIACKGLNVPVFISERVHPGYFRISWFWNLLRRLVYRYADALIVQTKSIELWCKERFSTTTYIIPNPITPTKKRLSCDSRERRTIAAAGRLMHQKGFDLLIDAFAQLASSFLLWDLVIYGEGEELHTLETLIRVRGLEGRVRLLGWQSQLDEALAEVDIFCLSSRFEGFPNVLCEAMRLGLAVVATDCPSGPADIITNGKDGILVEVGSDTELAQGLRQVMENESLRCALGGNAKMIGQRYSTEKILILWKECFDNTLRV